MVFRNAKHIHTRELEQILLPTEKKITNED